MCFGVVNPAVHPFLKALSTPTLVEMSRLRGLPDVCLSLTLRGGESERESLQREQAFSDTGVNNRTGDEALQRANGLDGALGPSRGVRRRVVRPDVAAAAVEPNLPAHVEPRTHARLPPFPPPRLAPVSALRPPTACKSSAYGEVQSSETPAAETPRQQQARQRRKLTE